MQGNYFVMVDNYYCGCIHYTTIGWTGHLTTDLVQGDDIGVLLEEMQ